MSKQQVTIGIPFYNDEKYLNLAIESVLNQTYTYWKLILIGDGGNDNSLSIARKYENDTRVTVVFDGKNRKLPYRLNQLIDLTDTKYMARMDADDIMHPKRIESQLRIMEDNPEIDVLGTNAYTIDSKNNVVALRNRIDQDDEIVEVKSFLHPTIFGKTEWFRDNKYDVDAIRMEDIELWYRTKDTSVFRVTTQPLLFYREAGGDYFKKYFALSESENYIKTKYPNNKHWKMFFKTSKVKGLIYYCFNLFNKEQFLLNRRNKITIKEVKDYSLYI